MNVSLFLNFFIKFDILIISFGLTYAIYLEHKFHNINLTFLLHMLYSEAKNIH